MRSLVFLCALLLASCASGKLDGNPDIPNRAPSAIVAFGDKDMKHAGVTYNRNPLLQEVYLDPDLDPISRRRVLTHELLHVAGFSRAYHSDDPECYFYHSRVAVLPKKPCDYELALIRQARGQFRVSVNDGRLQPDLDWSVAFWNRWAGRTVFIIP